MDNPKKILLTGAAGFIGSYLLGYLNRQGFRNIFIADEFTAASKTPNYQGKDFAEKIERGVLFDWLNSHDPAIEFVFHLGARTDTTEFNYRIHEELNVAYSKKIWHYCSEKNIPLVYASSAATYGKGEFGYKDDHHIVGQLQPLNPYGVSKNEFDKWALQQEQQPPFWAGLKFFNVYGPNEYHKERMASVILHAFKQISSTGQVRLFRSHHQDYRDGEQLRDFIYVQDVAAVCYWLLHHQVPSGLYNLGTGKARTFLDLVHPIFKSLQLPPSIEFIDTPADIRDKYQYFTEADMHKLRSAGYVQPFTSLEEGVEQYVSDYLKEQRYY